VGGEEFLVALIAAIALRGFPWQWQHFTGTDERPARALLLAALS